MMNKSTLILLFSVLIIGISSAQQKRHSSPTQTAEKITLENSQLANLYRIDQGVYRSEQPSKKDFIELENYGIIEILSLRNWHDDEDETRRIRLVIHTLKTRASKIDQSDIISALRIIKNRKGPILIHCWHGSDRTGAVCAMYRIVFQGWSKEKAIDEMVNGGFGFHSQFDQIITMIRNADIDKIKNDINK